MRAASFLATLLSPPTRAHDLPPKRGGAPKTGGVVVERVPRPAAAASCRAQSPPTATSGGAEGAVLGGVVKWFHCGAGYGFIRRQDTGADVFVHRRHIVAPCSTHSRASLLDGEAVEFRVVGAPRGPEARDITGPGGTAVQGSAHARPRPSLLGQGR